MHILQAQAGGHIGEAEAVDLGQDPADIIILSAADTELTALSRAYATTSIQVSLRLANLMALSHPMSVDLYLSQTAQSAKCVVVRVLGGESYWRYGLEQFSARCDGHVFFLPGDDKPDETLLRLSNVAPDVWDRLHRYFSEGGARNYEKALLYCQHLIDPSTPHPPAPEPVQQAGVLEAPRKSGPYAAIVFYRALLLAGDLTPIHALMRCLEQQGLTPVPIYVSSLKNAESQAVLERAFADMPPDIILNTTSFAVNTPGMRANSLFADTPILQVILSRMTLETWTQSKSGLSPKEIAMNIALPEVDGRIITRAVSFKSELTYDAATQCSLACYTPQEDRIAFVADLAKNWVTLRRTANADKKVAVVLANYPNKDSRLANGVGLDVPQSVVDFLATLDGQGYHLSAYPRTSAQLMQMIQAGTTNAAVRTSEVTLPVADYKRLFATLPADVQTQITARWGAPEDDPLVTQGAFSLPVLPFGNIIVGLQPARGYNIDPKETYHSPDLVPPHNYLAFYMWLRHEFGAHAVIQFGKHGNQEWLPGKSVALSQSCFPEVVFGPLPHLYPFIVNDPGEGTQAKRRAQAVVVDHLTPPLTRAESHGLMFELEGLLDEYADALTYDPKRAKRLAQDIEHLMAKDGLAKDAGIDVGDFSALDTYLCELKESQIRDGLHVFGASPDGVQETDLLVALLRCPRGSAPQDKSILRTLAKDLGLPFDPLDCVMGETWTHPKPAVLEDILTLPWRTVGDTVELLEALASQLVQGKQHDGLTHTALVLEYLEQTLRPHVQGCGAAETQGLLDGLDGKFVPPAPSGAPTRGRPDVLPTGRNFYSVDTRAVPTAAAWHLGWASATALIERHLQDHGDWLRSVALSVWGTSNMRTGGDDIAQAFALMGVRPTWDSTSRRVTGFEVLPLSVLDRPRVDVTLRISGFFRDAFPEQVALFDKAARAVMQLEEPPEQNPLAHKYQQDRARLTQAGHPAQEAQALAGYRIFGSQPGAYGAGLQALIDEDLWSDTRDFAEAFLTWGQYAYGAQAYSSKARGQLEERLAGVDAVLHNQDNREHDLLDSDDYYQFEGGLTAAVTHLRGAAPATYHNDHSRPERPVIRTLANEIGRVMRARVSNPKWIAGCQRHGYKGAFEMAATVDYLFAFAATTQAVASHHFDMVYAAYIADEDVQAFIDDNNPCALRDIKKRLRQAYDKGFWQPRSNSALKELCNDR